MKISLVPDNAGDALASEIASLTGSLQGGINGIVREVAEMTMHQAQALARSRLHSTKEAYERALHFTEVSDGIYSIILDPEFSYLEEGYPSFDMIQRGLARGAKSKVSKEGYRYVRIPFDHKQGAATSSQPAVANQPVQIYQAKVGNVMATSMKQLMQNEKGLVKQAGLKDTVNDSKGNPAIRSRQVSDGKGGMKTQYQPVAAILPDPLNKNAFIKRDYVNRTSDGKPTDTHYRMQDKHLDHRISGLMIIQHPINMKNGKVKTGRAYMTIRTASENPKSAGKWIHPGFEGAKIFPILQATAEQALMAKLEAYFAAY
jgi:hypothetical protein